MRTPAQMKFLRIRHEVRHSAYWGAPYAAVAHGVAVILTNDVHGQDRGKRQNNEERTSCGANDHYWLVILPMPEFVLS